MISLIYKKKYCSSANQTFVNGIIEHEILRFILLWKKLKPLFISKRRKCVSLDLAANFDKYNYVQQEK